MSNVLRGTAKKILCKGSGMSVFVFFHCELEKAIRGRDLKIIEGCNEEQCGKNLAAINVMGKRAELSN